MTDDSAEILFQCLPACRWPQRTIMAWAECPLFDIVHPAFSLPTTASPTLQGALKDGFVEAVVAYDIPKPSKFPSLDSCQKRFLWTHKEVDRALHPVIGLVPQGHLKRTTLLEFSCVPEWLEPVPPLC